MLNLRFSKNLRLFLALFMAAVIFFQSSISFGKGNDNLKADVYINNDNKNIGIEKIVSNGDSYVAVGFEDMLYSKDGIHWEVVLLPNVERARDIVWNGEQYILLGDRFTIFTSVDGLNWVEVNNLNYLWDQLGPGIHLVSYKFSYAEGRYLILIDHKLFMSTDLFNWEEIYDIDNCIGVEYNGKVIDIGYSVQYIFDDGETICIVIQYVGVLSFKGLSAIISSSDLKNWNIWLSDDGFTTFSDGIFKIAKDEEKFIAYGSMNKVYISYDGVTWQPRMLTFDTKNINLNQLRKSDVDISHILYKNNKYYGIINGYLLYSNDGFNWEFDSFSLNAEGLFFAGVYVADDGKILLYSNYSGRGNFLINFYGNFYYKENEKSDYIPIRKAKEHGNNYVAYGNGTYLIVNENGEIYTSDDGLSWEQQQSIKRLDLSNLSKVLFFNGKFLILKTNSLKYWYSVDGIEWKEAYFPEILVNGKYKLYPDEFILTENEIIAYMMTYPYAFKTTDGINWNIELIRNDIENSYSYIKYSNGLYIGESYNNETGESSITVSKNLKEWTKANGFPNIGTANNIIGFAGGNGKYLAVFSRQFLSGYTLSENGIDWKLKKLDLRKLYGSYVDEDEFYILKNTLMFEDLKWDGEKFIAIVRYRTVDSTLAPWMRDILISTDGENWESLHVDIVDNRTLNPPNILDNAQSVLTDDGLIFTDNTKIIVKVVFKGNETYDAVDWKDELIKNPYEEIFIKFSHEVDLESAKKYIFISKDKNAKEKLGDLKFEYGHSKNIIKVLPPDYGYDSGTYYLFVDKGLKPLDSSLRRLNKTIRMKFTVY